MYTVIVFAALTGWETKNRYKVTNSMGQQVMYVQERKYNKRLNVCYSNVKKLIL